ncbi:MAG TPA: HU family DNA-binding protein [Myxococcota bacterium]|nr:HU family DNA-binding protein [Myxococcota bacterium]HRY95973.1 HU family DNA-binding protein [Myxococcota bacterium]HSA22961.1 HU family DNA-binding protein [Myxococcota bacterium]
MADKKAMTKAQIVSHMAGKFEMPKKTVSAFFDELAELGYGQAKKVGMFLLPGFGKLVLAQRKARMGRNPATGEAIKIPAKRVVKIRVAKICKENIIPSKK